MKKTIIELPTGCTSDMEKKWKDKYGERKVKRRILILVDDGEEYDRATVVIRAPGRRDLDIFERLMERNPDKAKNVLITNCTLFGKERADSDDDYFMTLFSAIAELIPIGRVEVKNL